MIIIGIIFFLIFIISISLIANLFSKKNLFIKKIVRIIIKYFIIFNLARLLIYIYK
jgi:hypothetical protein